ncbi:unnamed protein product [Notodromas monacha]|uniref:Alpha-soluble NSF attachment protein n=1 Tax=Notodromas monacha TaxID=399045 RepID=A0A7R9BHM3_9CRUS|nr:unnamed protein product [Notodromas monacha]CAG0915646.1 unnamed protein product [Notodromas monacha]
MYSQRPESRSSPNYSSMDEANEKKGNDFIQEARKKLNSKGFLGGLFGSSSKVDEAVELLGRAANCFKMAKKWSAAGSAFLEAAKLHLDNGSRHDAATMFVDAATCYKKSEPNEAVNCLLKAIEIYTDMGRFTSAARHHISIAEIYETDLCDLEKAMQHYEQAADYYKGEESTSSANKAMLKVAQYAAQMDKFEKAISIYENDSRENKLIKTLIENMEENNVEGFSEAIKEYDTISRLDPWYTNMLLKVKKGMSESELC